MESSLALSAPPPLSSLLVRPEGIALFLDFDGTLVELASGPDAIKPKPDLADRLLLLSQRLEGRCALVSGRAISDIEKHIGPLAIAAAGSHGADVRSADGAALGSGAAPFPAEIEARMRAFAQDVSADYETKPHGGAMHYRSNPEAGPEAHAFVEALAQELGWKAQSGKCVVELVPPGADKGGAVRSFMETSVFFGATPIFVGDDLTDEAGFAACEAQGGGGVLVGSRESTCARYKLADVTAVHDWLEITQ